MWSTQMDTDSGRSFGEMLQEALDILRQDAGEYGYIALVGAVPAAVAVAIALYIGGAVATALVGPIIIIAAVLTLAAACAALGDGANNLQPDSARAFAAVLLRAPAILLPWAPLAIGLWTAVYAAVTLHEYIDVIPGFIIVLALVAASVVYGVPRALQVPALFSDELSWGQAERASRTLVQAESAHVVLTVTLCVLPAQFIAALAILAGGIDAMAAAIVTLFLVGAMPVAASLLTLIFFDVAERFEYDEAPSRGSPSLDVIQRAMPRR